MSEPKYKAVDPYMILPPEGSIAQHMRIIAAAIMEAETSKTPVWYDMDPESDPPDGGPPNHQKMDILRKLCQTPEADLFSAANYEKFRANDSTGMAQAGMYLADMRFQFFRRMLEISGEIEATHGDRIVWMKLAADNFRWAVTFRTRLEMHYFDGGKNG